MFSAVARSPVYVEPFHQSLAERIEAMERPGIKVVYYYDFPDSSTFRYRVHNPIELLKRRRPDITASWFSLAEFSHLEVACRRADRLVICRARYTDRIERLVDRFKAAGRQVVFDCDDYVFDPAAVGLLMRTLDKDVSDSLAWDTYYGYVARISGTMQLCDRVLVTNGFLASRAHQRFGQPVSVLDNWLNDNQSRLSHEIASDKRATGFVRDATIEIGYFSGSPSHNLDFKIVVPALTRLLARDRRVHLRLVGYLDIPPALASFRDRIRIYPMQNYLDLQSLIGETEINIAPLQDNVFTRCKSALKFFEAAAVGTLTVASRVGTLAQAMTSGSDGRLVSAYDWDDALQWAISSLDDGSYVALAEAAITRARSHHTADAHLSSLEAALEGCVAVKAGAAPDVRYA